MFRSVVLVIEDDEMLLKSLAITLELSGYTVVSASTAKDALNKMKTIIPHLILMDIGIPDINGVSLARCIRQLPCGNDIPIIVMSGLSTRIEAAKLSGVNFSAYLVKPILEEKLLEVINKLSPMENLITHPLAQGKHILIVDDDPVQLRLSRANFESAGFLVSTAVNGNEAFSIAKNAKIDIILSDIIMPEMDGFDLCREIRSNLVTEGIPIVLMTAFYLKFQDENMAISVGANALVEKKLGGEQHLINTVVKHINDKTIKEYCYDSKYLEECRQHVITRLEECVKVHDDMLNNMRQYHHYHPIFEIAIDNVYCGIEFLSTAGEIIKSNKFCEHIRLVPMDKVIGHPFVEYVSPNEKDRVLNGLDTLYKSKNIHLHNVMIAKSDGTTTIVNLTAALVKDTYEDQIMTIMHE